MSKLPPRLMFLDSMHYGMKRIDFIGFALFPRMYKEIERLHVLNADLATQLREANHKKTVLEEIEEEHEHSMFQAGIKQGEYNVAQGIKHELGKTHKDFPVPQATILWWLGFDEKGEVK